MMNSEIGPLRLSGSANGAESLWQVLQRKSPTNPGSWQYPLAGLPRGAQRVSGGAVNWRRGGSKMFSAGNC